MRSRYAGWNSRYAKKDLLKLVTRMQGVAERKSTMPVLSNVLLAVDGPSALRVAATDLYLALVGRVTVEVSKGGSVAVPAKDLLERIRMMPDGPDPHRVAGQRDDDDQGRRAARGATPCAACRETTSRPCPAPAEGSPSLALDVDVLQELVAKTHFSISTDETRAHLNSALFEWDGDVVRMVTTDGHRLSKMEVKVTGRQASATMLIPLKAIQELRRLCDDIVARGDGEAAKDRARRKAQLQITQSGSSAFFQGGGMTFAVRLVDAQFPPYSQVIPQQSEKLVRVPRARVRRRAARRVDRRERAHGRREARRSPRARCGSRPSRPRAARASTRSRSSTPGPTMTIGFNAKYFLDVLGALDDDEVELGFGGELDPAVVRPVGRAAVSRRRDADAHLTALRCGRSRSRVARAIRGVPQPRAASTSSSAPRFNVVVGRQRAGQDEPARGDLRARHVAELSHVEARRARRRGRETRRACARDVDEDGEAREQSVGLRRGRPGGADRRQAPADPRRVRRADADGRVPSRARSRSRWAAAPSDGSCSTGSRCTCRPASLADGGRLRARRMRARQRVLETRGATRRADLDDWEELMVRHGLAVMAARTLAARAARSRRRRERSTSIGAARGSRLQVRYARGAPDDAGGVPRRARLAVVPAIGRVARHGRTAPRRPGACARRHARARRWRRRGSTAPWSSRCELGRDRGRSPRPAACARCLLLDDVSSELDRARTAALFAVLREQQGQVLLTTTRPGAHRSPRRSAGRSAARFPRRRAAGSRRA